MSRHKPNTTISTSSVLKAGSHAVHRGRISRHLIRTLPNSSQNPAHGKREKLGVFVLVFQIYCIIAARQNVSCQPVFTPCSLGVHAVFSVSELGHGESE